MADLQTALRTANALTAGDYTVDSWAHLTTALGLADTTNTLIVTKREAINAALLGLITLRTDTELKAAQQSAVVLSAESYTMDSWAILESALALPQVTDALMVNKTLAIQTATT